MDNLQRKMLFVAALAGAFAVILGAFGAHSLAEHLTVKQLSTYQTAVDYHFFHSLALLGLVSLVGTSTSHQIFIKVAFVFFALGLLFFSGSLYLLACKNILDLEPFLFIIGPMTPIGGLFFIIAWLAVAAYALNATPRTSTS
jgi:uncharacterized membrane protein YgdD (TMEM256/DUF423 family)